MRLFCARTSAVAIGLLLFGVGAVSADTASTTSKRNLFGGKITVSLPRSAGAPKKVNGKTFQVQPTSSDKKFVIYVTREPLSKDETRKGNKQLSASIKSLLEAQGYEVIRLTNNGSTFNADFRSYANAPWQKVGTTAVRGSAKFIRTTSDELFGTILLCDPAQWTDSATKEFKQVVSSTTVTR